ncbi:transposase, partial [Crocosphaera sp. Alani8]|uniref:transposase n=1 Tax=Crocosphaera sp. Alani8 TaxID=3038952 RepID=UPI00313A77BF
VWPKFSQRVTPGFLRRYKAKGWFAVISIQSDITLPEIETPYGQFRDILKYVCKVRGKYFGVVDHRGTSQTCPNCRAEVRKTLSDRVHNCPECGYQCDRDVASAQEICNRGIETHSRQGLCRRETVCQTGRTSSGGHLQRQPLVEVSGVMSLDNWRRGNIPLWAERSPMRVGKPTP